MKRFAALACAVATILAFGLHRPTRAANIGSPAITFTSLAGTSTAIPGGTGSFTAFSPDPLLPPNPCISFGNVAFFGAGASGQQGIYEMRSGASVTKIADLMTAIPGGTGNFMALENPSISGSKVVFLGSDASGQQGVYVAIPPGPPVKIADLMTAVPGGTGNFTVFPPGPPTIGGDNVAFLAGGSGGQQGVYVTLPPGPPSKIADTATAIPGGLGNFNYFLTASTDGDNVAIVGGYAPPNFASGPQQGVYKMAGAPLALVADVGTAVPGGVGMFWSFGNVAIDPGVVVFQGSSDDGAGGERVGIYTDLDGALSKIIATGDTLDGKTIAGLGFGPGGFSNGQVVFGVQFADGSAGISMATVCAGGSETPQITCPADVAAKTAPGQATVAVLYPAPGVTANCPATTVTVTCTAASGSNFAVGTTPVTCTAASGAGLSSSCSFDVVVTRGYRCPLSQGYWKNNPKAWPVASLTLGSQTYTQAELLQLLKTSTTSDASLVLARQLIAAELNIANLSDPAPVNGAISDAGGLLSRFAGKLPYGVKTGSTLAKGMVGDASVLENYNTGALTPGCTP